jgi:N-methylhydantoinase A
LRFIVGVDIGGTFTDSCAVSTEDGSVFAAKSPTTPKDLTDGLIASLSLLASEAGVSLEELLRRTEKFAHGTTQSSNAIFTWSGANVGLITTSGFRDEILIMRARGRVAGLSLTERRHLRATQKPPKVLPEEMIVEVSERIDHRGRVLVPLTEQEARRAVNELLSRGVEAIAISLLWAPVNSKHELLLQEVLEDCAPGLPVTMSHEIAPVVGEYERTTTTVMNAYVAPVMQEYLRLLSQRLQELGLRCPILVLQASGGVVQAEDTVPVNTVESGPAAGLIGASLQASVTGHENIIATDVGGTTFKVGLIVDGKIEVARETTVNQYSMLIPMVDLVSIGAGGGSIAWVDETRLRVGPKSAGADPGPACYGWGGTAPTVTDADVVLGFLGTETFLGGQLKLREDLAREALRPIAKELFDDDVLAAAGGIRAIVDAQMGDLLRKSTIERGYDPRKFVLFAYGGAGPLHAAGYAVAARVARIIVPESATVFSAYGAAASDIQVSRVQSVPPELLEYGGDLDKTYRELENGARVVLDRQNVRVTGTMFSRWAEMRYARQLHDVRVQVPSSEDGHDRYGEALKRAFIERYEALYGTAAILIDAPVHLLRIGVDAVGIADKPSAPVYEPTEGEPERLGERRVFWPETSESIDTPVFSGVGLLPGHTVSGPAIVERPGTTIVVPQGVTAVVDQHRNTVLNLEGRI